MRWSAFLRARRGSVAILVVLMIAVIIGFVSLGAEVGYLLLKHREMQSAADAAALAGATAMATGYPSDLAVEARAVAAAAGFVTGADGVIVSVNHPPQSGSYSGQTNAIEVIVSQPQTLRLAGLFYTSLFDVSARAVTLSGAGQYCVLALDKGTSGAVQPSNGTTINLINCGLAVNSTSATSIIVSGGATINALGVTTAGGYSMSNGGQINAQNGIAVHAAPTRDPYAGHAVPIPGGCLKTNYHLGGGKSDTLSAGTYCGGIAVDNGGRLTLNPGTYILNNGDLSISGGGTLSGVGVSIVLTGSSSVGSVHFSNGSTVNISAPTSGPTSGFAFFQDPKAVSSGSNDLTGGSSQVITGAIYFPNQEVNFSGGSGTALKCNQLIADTLNFSGGATLQLDCAGMPIQSIGSAPAQLVQ
jgi:hypothetical protein